MATAVLQISSSHFISARDAAIVSSKRAFSSRSPLGLLNSGRFGTSLAAGSTPVLKTSYPIKPSHRRASVTVRCEQTTKEGSSLDIWLGRFAMIGFAVAISVEISTGKGLLENFGLTSPLPTVALAVTTLVGILATVFIFQSASKS
ncbi:unnamed protein product [Cuscuta campestris]|uniref:Stress enhanced protein 1, chloroplastic n=2 Tax=Cuscuta sect. Cleistogrammica TaxID=1824901 RepID=A0A484LQN6_9ASTE|nr:hypothetical protein DM860_003193 [Cuscuta australis]VFQ78286.1 unnamed protein product [Cuscuta campestris]